MLWTQKNHTECKNKTDLLLNASWLAASRLLAGKRDFFFFWQIILSKLLKFFFIFYSIIDRRTIENITEYFNSCFIHLYGFNRKFRITVVFFLYFQNLLHFQRIFDFRFYSINNW